MMKIVLALTTMLLPVLTFGQEAEEIGLDKQIDNAFQPVSDFFSKVIFFEIGGIITVLVILQLQWTEIS